MAFVAGRGDRHYDCRRPGAVRSAHVHHREAGVVADSSQISAVDRPARCKHRMTLLHSLEWRGRSCVVTGAAGFIGTALCRELAARGAQVHGWSRKRHDDRVLTSWHECDVTDEARVAQLVASLRPEV